MLDIRLGDCRELMAAMEPGSVRCCVTSPPYWGLRDYGHAGQLGLERTPEEYVARMVEVFREVRRVLADDGTLWLNLGDSYAGSGMTGGTNSKEGSDSRAGRMFHGNRRDTVPGMKQKDLTGIPWMVAFALRSDGWWLRSDIIWAKPNPMPESVTDRPTKAHEYLFLLAKSERYYYDAAAIAEPANPTNYGNYILDIPGGVMYIGFMKTDMPTPSPEVADPAECAHKNVSRGRIYDFCEDCSAVRRAPTGATVVEPWHSCHACRTTR